MDNSYSSYISSVFEEFQKSTCSELFKRYNGFVETVAADDRKSPSYIRACFMLSYCCILFKDVANAGNWRLRFQKAIGIPDSEDGKCRTLSNKEAFCDIVGLRGEDTDFGLYAVQDMFLEAHISFLSLNLSSLYSIAEFGMVKSEEIGCAPFHLFFLVLSGWLNRYLQKNTAANACFAKAESYLREHFEPNCCDSFFADMVSAGIRHDTSAVTDTLNGWAGYYYNEFSQVARLLDCGIGKVSERTSCTASAFTSEFYNELFGEMVCGSNFDRILSLFASGNYDNAWENCKQELSYNQRLYCEIAMNRPLTLAGINDDAFIIAPSELCEEYSLCVRQNALSNANTILNVYDSYLRNSRFQINLSATMPLLKVWLEKKKGTVNELVSLETVTGISERKDLSDATERCALCTDNLKCICDLQTCLSDMEWLDLSTCIYKLSPIVFPDKSDAYNAYVKSVVSPLNDLIPRLNNITENDGHFRLGGILSYYGGILSRTFPALLDNEIIRSVIVVQNIENTENTKRLMDYLGEPYDQLDEYERKYLETLIGNVFNENPNDLESSSVTSSGLYMKVWVNGSVFFNIYIFSRKGKWEIEDDNRWRNDSSDTVVSPLPSIFDSDACKQKVPIVFLQMSGTRIDEKEFYKKTGDKNIRLYTISRLRSELTPETSNIDSAAIRPQNFKYAFLDSIFKGKPEVTSIDDNKAGISVGKNIPDWDFIGLMNYIREYSFTETQDVYVFEGKIPGRVKSFGLTQMIFAYAEQVGKVADVQIEYTAQFVNLECAFVVKIASKSGEIELKSFAFYSKHPCDGEISYLAGAPFQNDLKHRVDVHPKIEAADDIFCDILKSNKDGLKNCQEAALVENYFKFRSLELAVKNARIAIMSRNVSHNLGSHVMAYLKYHLGSLEAMLSNQVFDQLFRNEKEFENFLEGPSEWTKEKGLNDKYSAKTVALPFLIGLGKFISYIQQRQDFIACVATDFVPSSTAQNFKDYIYDELNIDKRSLRHRDRMGEVPDNILLGNIARSEGLQREHYLDSNGNACCQNANDIVLKFRTFDGNKPADNTIQAQDLDDMRRYTFSIPGGVTGRHAFFTIVENIIRNAAKHGKRDGQKSLEITFDVFDVSDFERSCDNDACDGEYTLREVFGKYYVTADDAADLYFVTITDNFRTEYDDLQRIREAIAEDYVKDGVFIEKSKGLKEMRICAAWLRGQHREFHICSPKETCKHDREWTAPELMVTVPTLYARLSNGHLQFIFAVKKPMEVLLLTNSLGESESEKIREVLSRYCWRIISTDEFCSGQPMPNFDFVIFMDDDKEEYDKLKWKHCGRMFRLGEVPGLCGLKEFLSEIPNKNEQIAERLREYKEKILWRFSGYEEGDRITVSDDKALKNFKRQLTEAPSRLSQYINVGDGIKLGDYSYMKHYETVFDNVKDLGISHRFVESISGANSTDRLVRCEPMNIEWFCRHLHAMKQRIAVFDERLANKILDVGHEGVMFADKDVWIFNIVKSDSERKFSIYGVSPDKKLTPDNKRTVVTRIASLTVGENVFDIKCEDDCGMFRNYFDKITIHQGLLDKIYSMFGIKSDNAAKEKATQKLYEVFHKNGKDEILEKDGHFLLPGMSIHSGRSKPIEDDMPQRLPFIQYASLEYAVFDSKYTLTELLETTKI